MDSELANIRQKVKRELADYLGIEMEDIEDESVLSTDFHMDAVSLTDFMEILEKANVDISAADLTEIETFGDLIDAVSTHI